MLGCPLPLRCAREEEAASGTVNLALTLAIFVGGAKFPKKFS
jgi:hypothetical protein